MQAPKSPISRIVEPYIKAIFAKWLVERGAQCVAVSIDGNETGASEFPVYFMEGFEFERNQKSRAKWAGRYMHRSSVVIETCCLPGADIRARFPSGETWVAECKGEATESGIKAGADLTSIYCGLGQLLATAGKMDPLPERRFLVVPKSDRLRETIQLLHTNPLLDAAKIEIALVDRYGDVSFA